MSTVFNEESHKALLAIKQVAKAVSATTTSSTAGLKDDDTLFTLSRSLPEVTAAVREVGNKMLALLDKFEKAVEEQLVTFYRTMKQNVENEHQILRTTKSLMPSDPSLLKHLVTATQQQLQTATASYLVASGQSPRPVSPKIAPLAASKLLTAGLGSSSTTLPPIKSPRRLSPTRDGASAVPNQSAAIAPVTKDTVGIASESLKSWLFVTLQSTMQLCEASRGAVYIRANEGTAYLRRVCGINAEERLPLDVSPAAGSTIATVVQNSIGVNIGRSRFKNPYALDNYSTASQAVRASVAIKITTGLILPIGDVGCILVADKTTESLFSELDEHILWSASMMIRGALKRYPVELLTGKLTSTTVHALNAHAMLPPIAADATPYRIDTREQQQLLEISGKADLEYVMSPEEELQALCPGIVHVPRLPKKLVMIRANERGGFQSILSKDLESLKRAELSDEDLLEAAVPYITNLEALWRKSIDSMTELRSTCEKLDKELSLRNTRIVELEVEVRVLTRQYSAMRADVHRIRQAVPALLRDNGEQQEVVDDTGKASAPTGRPSRKNTTVQPTPPQAPLSKKLQPPHSAR